MTGDDDLTKQIREAQRRLLSVRKERDDLGKLVVSQREKCDAVEQAELDAFAASGKDPLQFVPSAELRNLKKALQRSEQNLHLLESEEMEILRLIEQLTAQSLERELLEVTRQTRLLEARKQELEAELKQVTAELERLFGKQKDLARTIAERSSTGSDSDSPGN